METLSIDIETYSGAELSKTGVYRYCQDPDFEILLFGYSMDGGSVCVVDFTAGEQLPEEVLAALTDNSVTKWAYNCTYERVCISAWLKRHGYPLHNEEYAEADYLDPAAWRCTMIWSAYLGLPMSLADVGAVLGLEKQKLDTGKDLIRCFCKPCTPAKANGMRTRNMPSDYPDKWRQFKIYNERDVETELEIKRRLATFPVPEDVWAQYRQDQEINDRGILVDTTLVKNAISMDTRSHETLTSLVKQLTQLENPSSVQQMKHWLSINGMEVETLGKKQVTELIKDAPPLLREVLSLRLQLSKSSVKKYLAMQSAVCADNRIRGCFQFYGANRTGRFCLTGDHEVLTEKGWVRLDEWDERDAIACWNSRLTVVSFQQAKRVEFDYTGPMYTYQDVRIDQCSTPDHKMYVQPHYGAPWQDMTVKEMAEHSPVIPMTGNRIIRYYNDNIYLRVMLMVQADGAYTDVHSIMLNFKKRRKIERCKYLLRKAEIIFTERKHGDVTRIDIAARDVPLWLRQFKTKEFGTWLFDENPEIIFDELPNWDGYRCGPHSIQYTTCNKKNADIIQAIAHMSGRCAVMKIRHPQKDTWQTAYVLDIWENPKSGHIIKGKPVISDFDGKVYCAVTSTGYFLVRRNGRVWVTGNSGRLVQLQNLYRNSLPDLDTARELVRSGDYETVDMLYGSVPEVLSELIRTAFIAPEGKKLFVADFSAIEARVIAWLAGEKWRMQLFHNNGDIYCQSASTMFHVPVEKHGINGHLRQKGKIAELACIAEGEPVLTDLGLVLIQSVTPDMRVWDGESWVHHDGVVYRGVKEVITYDGLTATPDHLVWHNGQPVQFGTFAGNAPKRTARVYDILNAGPNHRFTVSGHLVHNCGYGGSVGALKAMGALEMGLTEDELLPLVQAWRDSNPNIVRLWWDIDAAAMTAVVDRTETYTHGLRFRRKSGMLFVRLPSGRMLTYVKPVIGTNKFGSPSLTYMGVGNTKRWERLETYGCKLCENLIQGIARDVLCYAMQTLSDCRIVAHVHDEVIIEADADASLEDICERMSRTPPWAEGLELRADGYVTPFYKKD